MSERRIWSGVVPLSLLLAVILGLWILGRVGRARDAEVERNGLPTVGVAFDEGSRMISIRYTVEDEEYTSGVGKRFSNIQDGEEYLVKYLPADPTRIVVFFDQPIFSDRYEYAETECLAMDKVLSVVSFDYVVDGKPVERNAPYTDGQSLNPDDYVVRYRVAHPSIGYLIAK